MAHKDATNELGKSLVNELKSVEVFPPYNAKAIKDIATEICKRKEELASVLS